MIMQMIESNIYQKILDETQNYYESCVKIYRTIHRQPEIGLLQHKTSSYIRQILSDIEGISIDEVLPEIPTAVIARINIKDAKETILIRSELDALNFKEQSGLEHASINHLHHACGHDGHMASLVTAIKIASKYKEHLKKNVIFCFQPGQEGKGGAYKLMNAKPDLLNGVDSCYALHFMNAAPPGTIYLSSGAVTAISIRVNIVIEGVSVHCMSPNFGIDANFIGCTLVTQLYSLIGLKIAPLQGATFVIYKVEGGQNVAKVSDRFEITGSLRTTTMDSFNRMKQAIQSLSQNLCSAYGAKKPTIIFGKGLYRPVVNDQALTALTKKKLQAMIPSLIIQQRQKSFAGQDFCQFSQKRPSCYIAVGAALPNSIDPKTNESIYPLHSPYHKFDQSVFKYSTKIWTSIMLD